MQRRGGPRGVRPGTACPVTTAGVPRCASGPAEPRRGRGEASRAMTEVSTTANTTPRSGRRPVHRNRQVTGPVQSVDALLHPSGRCRRRSGWVGAARRGGVYELLPTAALRVSPGLRCRGWVVPMSMSLEELTICVGDGCESLRRRSRLGRPLPGVPALWDDHAAGQHDPPVDPLRRVRPRANIDASDPRRYARPVKVTD